MIKLEEELTRKVWHFEALPNVGTNAFFMFNGQPWVPGFYVLSNLSGADVDVVLFGQAFTIPDQSKWRFMAHQELESFQVVWAGTGPVGKQFPYGSAGIPSTGL